MQGFRVGYAYGHPLSSAKRNMSSALQHPEVVERYLQEEVKAGRILGPFNPGEIPGLHISRFGVIPKGRDTGRWRLITDLSFPEGTSVNDGISPALCTLQYTSVDNIARAAHRLGPGALLAKADIKAAYRLVPVHPDDRKLLGVAWNGAHYVDAMLPFGLRSAPKVFTAVADALEWCIRQQGVTGIDHYLDDFVIVAPPTGASCHIFLQTMQDECASLGVTLAPEKTEGPTTCLVFLGIEVDTVAGRLRLPREKLIRLQQDVDRWLGRKTCQRRELESLVGTLQHAAKVISPGRSFVRRMIELLKGPRRPYHYVRLNRQFQADLHWWKVFAEGWNGVALFPPTVEPSIEFASDASGHWGCGAWCQDRWWQLQWPQSCELGIAFKELFVVVLSAAAWGKGWRGCQVLGHCDNEAVTHVVRSRSSKNPQLMHLLRCLFFIEAECAFALSLVHIAGVDNDLADDLSRDKLSSFLAKVPQAQPLPTPLPPPLLELLFDTEGTWTSPIWTQRFKNSVAWV